MSWFFVSGELKKEAELIAINYLTILVPISLHNTERLLKNISINWNYNVGKLFFSKGVFSYNDYFSGTVSCHLIAFNQCWLRKKTILQYRGVN
jgi:hypothetical protein